MLALRSEGAWSVHPWRSGLGGTPLVVAGDNAPAAWQEASDSCVASHAAIIASAHEAGVRRDFVIEAYQTHTATPVERLTLRGDGWTASIEGERRTFPVPSDLEHRDAQVLQSATLWCWRAEQGQPSWQFANAYGFLAERAASRKHDEILAWQRRRSGSFVGDAFVNPYNFVPLHAGPTKKKPSAHLELADGRMSGRLSVRLTARSPLALSGAGSGSEQDPNRPLVNGDRWVVLGSQFAGAVRSFHEALTDSCLRVIDLAHVPVHRDVARPQEPGRWRMAVVEPDGRSVRLCDPVNHAGKKYSAVWVEARDLARGAVDSALEYHFDLASAVLVVPEQRFRVERAGGAVPVECPIPPGTPCSTAHWRTIVTEPLPGRVPGPVGQSHPYHLPFARVSSPLGVGIAPVDETVLLEYRRSAEDAADVATRRRGGTPSLTVHGVGQRQETTAELTAGHVVWAHLTKGRVDRVTPSVLWRTPGRHAVGDRVSEYTPCTDPAWLCPSCALFGMVEERENAAGGAARVDAYRGHVRFGLGVVSNVDPEATHLREMGTPKPGAGQFYLVNGLHVDKQARRGERPLREWGSAADQPSSPRRIRGRKFYWANSTGDRHLVAGGDAHESMSSFHHLSPVGTTVSFPVWFDNLTPAQLGSLLVSLRPDVLRHDRVRAQILDTTDSPALIEALDKELCLHLGKGKGLGLGAVASWLGGADGDESSTVPTSQEARPEARNALGVEINVWTEERYQSSNSEPKTVDSVSYVQEFVTHALATGMASGWAPLAALSALDWVPGDRVSYPPDDEAGEDFTFDFWKASTGAAGTVTIGNASKIEPTLVILPEADAADVTVKRPWLVGES